MIQIRGAITSEYVEGICCVSFYLDTHTLNFGVYNFCGSNTNVLWKKNHTILKYNNVGSYCILLPTDCVNYRICYVYNYFSFFLPFFKKRKLLFQAHFLMTQGELSGCLYISCFCLFILNIHDQARFCKFCASIKTGASGPQHPSKSQNSNSHV